MKKELNYMAIDKEGKFVAVICAGRPEEVARETGKWIRAGLSVERCSDDYVRKHFGDIIRPIGDIVKRKQILLNETEVKS